MLVLLERTRAWSMGKTRCRNKERRHSGNHGFVYITIYCNNGRNQSISRFFDIIALVSYYYYSYNNSKKLGLDEELEETWMGENMLAVFSIVTVLGGVMIVLGAELLIEGSTGIADSFGISESIVGLSVIALGTSLPELAVTVIGGYKRYGRRRCNRKCSRFKCNKYFGILEFPSAYAGGIIVSDIFAARDIWVVTLLLV